MEKTNLDAFFEATEEQIEEALKKAWDKNGYCNSCSWHSAFYEVRDDLEPENESVEEWWTWCHSKDKDENDDSHRGCYIYPDFKTDIKTEGET